MNYFVSKCLKPDRNIYGLYIQKDNKRLIVEKYKIENDKSIILYFKETVPQNTELWYGYDPNHLYSCCTLVDEQDMALPVTGPIII